MDINKRTILWIVFSVSLIILWNNWMVANGNQSMFSMTPPPAKVVQAPAATNAAGVPVAAGVPALPGAPVAPPAIKTEVITITTDVFKVDIDTAGGVGGRWRLGNLGRRRRHREHGLIAVRYLPVIPDNDERYGKHDPEDSTFIDIH